MGNIVIAGGGFAGIAAAKNLAGASRKHKVVLFDKNPYATVLSVLPDLAGGKISKKYASGDIRRLVPRRVEFIQDTITSIDLDQKTVTTSNGGRPYDKLVIASGSVVNFSQFTESLENVYRLDSIAEADRLRNNFLILAGDNSSVLNVVIAGAAYTGLELAASLKYLAVKNGCRVNIILVDIVSEILPFIDAKEREYIRSYLEKIGVQLRLRSRITGFDGRNVGINNSETIANAMLCWAGGTRFSIDKLKGKAQRLQDGRLVVNSSLQLPAYPDVFAAGDAAAFQAKEGYLRKSVNFAIHGGAAAGRNVALVLAGRAPAEFKPSDPGWIIPLQDISVGRVYRNIKVKGRFWLRAHYFLCGVRNFSLGNLFYFIGVALRLFRKVK